MEIIFNRPKNNLLADYIEGYYFLSSKHTKLPNYLTFPNNFTIITFIRNGFVDMDDNIVSISKQEGNSILSIISTYGCPWEIRYLDAVDELTVYFKPSAIQSFFPEFVNPSTNSIDVDYGSLKQDLAHLFLEENWHSKELLLDNYLLSIFNPKKDFLLSEIIDKLDRGHAVSEIAQNLNLSRQYINRYFKNKIGKSPTNFRVISRFRKTINTLDSQSTLTRLTYENLFFDQAHFNKNFRRLTSSSPVKFIHKIVDAKPIVWMLI